jgi:hypothetical protein
VVKRSLSFPADLFAEVEQEAKAEGVAVSTVVTEAARQWLIIRRGLRAVREWEAEHGAFTDQELAEADALLDAALRAVE